MCQRRAHAIETFRLDADDLCRRRQIVEGERNAADQPTAADRTEQEVGAGTLGLKLVERFEAGAGLAGDDLRIVERMQQGQAFGLSDLARLGGGDFLTRALAMVGQHDAGAIARRGVALGGRCVDRHDDGDGNAKRLAGSRQPLREIAGGIGDDALLRLVNRKLLQPPIGAAHLERAGPLQRFRLDEDAGCSGLAGQCRRFQQRRDLRRPGCDGIGLLEMVEGGDEKV
jgi:hypothetical protein